MHQFHKFILAWDYTCFGQFLCPSSGVYSLYTQQWYVSYRFVDSFRAGPGWNCSSILVQVLTFKNFKLSDILKFSDFNETPTNSLMMIY